MEILIKAKQSNNPQFSFLSIDGVLHPYYKLVLEAIKSGKYNPDKQPDKDESGKLKKFNYLLFLLINKNEFVNLNFYIFFFSQKNLKIPMMLMSPIFIQVLHLHSQKLKR